MNFDALKDQVSNLTLYDVKAGIRKVQNAVMNYTEMESKVREATNNEPWGASSTMMQEIASGTFNYQLLNEIMPMIYKRFTEKSAEEWRQIYKALQLMEFLVKNGSERVIDDARSHLSLIKMLRQFHYIDENGKDQGVNVRNRSKELSELLSDVDRIRAERKKARQTKNKYSGVEGGSGIGIGGGGSSSRYGGFGSESAGHGAGYGGQTRNVYGDGGGFGGESQMEYDAEQNRGGSDNFEEYNEFDDGGAQAAPARRKPNATAGGPRKTVKKAEPPKPKEPEVDLFDFGDDDAPAASSSSVLAPPSSHTTAALDDDDDFDEFQSATPDPVPVSALPSIPKPNYSSILPPKSTATTSSATQFAQPTPQSGAQQAGFNNLFSTASPASSTSAFSAPPAQNKPSGYQPSGPNYFTSVQIKPGQQSASTPGSGAATPSLIGSKPAAKKPASGDAFASLLSGSAIKKPQQQKGLSIADMAKQKSQAGLYGANAAPSGGFNLAASNGSSSKAHQSTGSSGLDDLLG
ncbi:ENTH-domain-containing protein [Acrodontium crateriforme]|uniref:ENTH-domain-containing protein n=1 Tax=Acrodontium crateriforme TaxID=150365 RepID=A0AAQ3M7Z9_9PEZI|nr:ENTH-domain-containing protein [Acrodontium crateriforme]